MTLQPGEMVVESLNVVDLGTHRRLVRVVSADPVIRVSKELCELADRDALVLDTTASTLTVHAINGTWRYRLVNEDDFGRYYTAELIEAV